MKTKIHPLQPVIAAFAFMILLNLNAIGQESYSISLQQAQQIALEKAFAV